MMDESLILAFVLILILVLIFFVPMSSERYIGSPMSYYLGPSFNTVDSAPDDVFPVSYYPRVFDGSYRLGRWRRPVAQSPSWAPIHSRQIADETWDQRYNSGQGFQLQ